MPVKEQVKGDMTERRDPERAATSLDQRRLLSALRAFRKGEVGVRLPADASGLAADIAEAFNDAAEMHDRMAAEFERISVAVGKEGRVAERASLSAQ